MYSRTLALLFSVAVLVSCVSALAQERRLIKLSAENAGEWVNLAQIAALRQQNVHFIDITEIPSFPKTSPSVRTSDIPTSVEYQTTVNSLIPHLDIERIRTFLDYLTSFYTRRHITTMGRVATLWLEAEIKQSVSRNNEYPGKVSVSLFEHSWLQPSLIARIEGSDPSQKSEIVILGAHIDSVNWENTALPAPGADDAGSAVPAILEVFHIILENNFVPKRTLEFQFYAGEEEGLRGSRAIARNYSDSNVNVFSMLNMDLAGLFSRPNIGITVDETDGNLNDFIRLLVNEYLEYGLEDYECGYACSDHAAFTEFGFASTFPVEPYWFRDGDPITDVHHKDKDTVEMLDFNQILEYAKLALAYAVEIGQPTD